MTDPPDLKLKFGGRLVEQLGAQMYPSATATVAELISNAWDADASNVWVVMPFKDWEHGAISVVDDGVGMDLQSAQEAYLIVGRNRRRSTGETTARDRLVHGRKGIGKLAAFGTAKVLELKTLVDGGQEVSFRLDYDRIRAQEPDIPYRVEESTDHDPLTNPITGQRLDHGTRIRLSGLQLKRRLDPDSFVRSMSRRFALDDREMSVFINGERLHRYEVDLEYRFPPRELPPGVMQVDDWAVETLPDGNSVRWWIGFTPKPIRDGQQGLSVIVRGRLAQRPFKFDAGGGTSNQLGQEYLVGEVVADWIDAESGDGDGDDLIQSNRDQLQLEAELLLPFVEWGQTRIRWALNQRGSLKRQQGDEHASKNKRLEKLLAGRPNRERKALSRVASAVASLPETGDDDVVRVMQAVVDARGDEAARLVADDITLSADVVEFLPLVRELAELDSRSSLSFIEARLGTLDRLRSFGSDLVSETLVDLLMTAPGLFRPLWDTATVSVSTSPHYWVAFIDLQRDTASSVAVIVPRPGADPSELSSAVRDTAALSAGREVFAVTGGDDDLPAVRSWRTLLDDAEQGMRGWQKSVTDRLARSIEA